MRTFQLPNVFRTALKTGSLALVTASPLVAASPITAAEPATSLGFVNRDALGAGDTIGWRNPLRAGSASAATDGEASNSLRQNVTPVSYEEEAAASGSRSAPGLQLRPHTEPTGILSGVFNGGSQTFSKPRPTSAPANTKQPQFQQAKSNVPTAQAASKSAFRYMPSFKSSSARKPAPAAATAQAAANARAGSAAPQSAHATAQRPTTRTTNQPTYGSAAAAAQAYQPNRPPAARTSVAQRPPTATRPSPSSKPRPINTPLARPTMTSKRQAVAAPATPPNPANSTTADPTTPAGILTRAHQSASTARTEEDFSKILAMCQQVPARSATAEETTFGRELAAWALNRRGQLKARSGDNEAAMADFDQSIRIDAKCWRALHNRGVLMAQAGQFEPAFDDFHHTIELNPNYAKAYANRGALYVLAGELEPALADYQQAVALDPNFAIAERGCGRTCHMLGQIDEALDHLSRAIELAPRDANALASRADLLTDLGEYAAAAHDYEQALAIQPKYADAYRGSAWLLATCPDNEVRNPEVALERAQIAVELDRKADATTFDTLAAAQASVGDFQSASQTIRQAIEIAPPSERSVYQDRMQMYRQSKPYRIEPVQAVQQAGYEQ